MVLRDIVVSVQLGDKVLFKCAYSGIDGNTDLKFINAFNPYNNGGNTYNLPQIIGKTYLLPNIISSNFNENLAEERIAPILSKYFRRVDELFETEDTDAVTIITKRLANDLEQEINYIVDKLIVRVRNSKVGFENNAKNTNCELIVSVQDKHFKTFDETIVCPCGELTIKNY